MRIFIPKNRIEEYIKEINDKSQSILKEFDKIKKVYENLEKKVEEVQSIVCIYLDWISQINRDIELINQRYELCKKLSDEVIQDELMRLESTIEKVNELKRSYLEPLLSLLGESKPKKTSPLIKWLIPLCLGLGISIYFGKAPITKFFTNLGMLKYEKKTSTTKELKEKELTLTIDSLKLSSLYDSLETLIEQNKSLEKELKIVRRKMNYYKEKTIFWNGKYIEMKKLCSTSINALKRIPRRSRERYTNFDPNKAYANYIWLLKIKTQKGLNRYKRKHR